jgi:hypothetical protein
MVGGLGDDRYVLGAAWGLDSIIEMENEGNDTLDLTGLGNADLTVLLATSTTSGANVVTHSGNRIENFVANANSTGDRLLQIVQPGEEISIRNGSVQRGSENPVYFSGFNKLDVDVDDGVVHVLDKVQVDGLLKIKTGTLDLQAGLEAQTVVLDIASPLLVTQPASLADGLGEMILVKAQGLRILHDGGVGTDVLPLYIQVDTLEIITDGINSNTSGVYIVELDGLTIGDVVSAGETQSGIKTLGGNISVLNLTGEMIVAGNGIEAGGGSIVLTTDLINVQAQIRSWYQSVTGGSDAQRGTLVLQPLSAFQSIGVGVGATGLFNLTGTEMDFIINGFGDTTEGSYDGIAIGRMNGRHIIQIGTYAFQDSVTMRAPQVPGAMYVVGVMSTIGEARIRFIGSASTGTP